MSIGAGRGSALVGTRGDALAGVAATLADLAVDADVLVALAVVDVGTLAAVGGRLATTTDSSPVVSGAVAIAVTTGGLFESVATVVGATVANAGLFEGVGTAAGAAVANAGLFEGVATMAGATVATAALFEGVGTVAGATVATAGLFEAVGVVADATVVTEGLFDGAGMVAGAAVATAVGGGIFTLVCAAVVVGGALLVGAVATTVVDAPFAAIFAAAFAAAFEPFFVSVLSVFGRDSGAAVVTLAVARAGTGMAATATASLDSLRSTNLPEPSVPRRCHRPRAESP